MNELTYSIQEALSRQLKQKDLDLVGLIPIPATGDRMVRLQTLEEVLDEFDDEPDSSMIGYLVQIRPKSLQAQLTQSKAQENAAKPSLETIYLPNGKLNVPFLVQNAELLFEAGEFVLARNVFKAVLGSGERPSVALAGLGRCLEAEGKITEAQKSYEEALAYHPSVDVYQRLSNLLIQQRKDHEAAEVLERALNLKNLDQATRFELHKACGNCWTRAHKTGEAEKHFKQALGINPSADGVQANLGVLHLQNARHPEARRHFQDALASNPRNDKALSGLGSCALAEGNKATAHDYFAQALEINSNNPNALLNLVKCAYELKTYATATRILENYIQTAPVNANLLYSLAGLQFHLGRITDSRKTTEKVLALQPEHLGAKDLMEMIRRYSTN